jgi:glycerol 2-dehydrogenase (NADP+)
VAQSVRHAISVGYRHIDAAYFYGNEGEVGAALRDVLGRGEVRREDLFITTKLWCTYHGRVEQNLDLSFDSLGLDYVDLYLMHWLIAMNPNGLGPCAQDEPDADGCQGDHETHPRRLDGSRDLDLGRSHVDTYRDMEKLLATGKARAIGVANYSVDYLRDLLAHVSVVPAVNQVDSHPQLPQAELLDFCRAHGIHNTAYSPLGSTGGPLLSVPAVQTIAAAKQVSPGNILLSYHGGWRFQFSLTVPLTFNSCTGMLGVGQVRDALADTGESTHRELE